MSFALVYSSTAASSFTRTELEDLLTYSRAHNQARGVTGMLLYRDGRILQLLEGDERVVLDLYATITADRRHQDVILLWAERDRNSKLFPEWSMSFRDLTGGPVVLDGYSTFMSEPSTIEEALRTFSVGEELLALFRRAA